MKKKVDSYCFETINDELNKLFNSGKFKLKEEKKNQRMFAKDSLIVKEILCPKCLWDYGIFFYYDKTAV